MNKIAAYVGLIGLLVFAATPLWAQEEPAPPAQEEPAAAAAAEDAAPAAAPVEPGTSAPQEEPAPADAPKEPAPADAPKEPAPADAPKEPAPADAPKEPAPADAPKEPAPAAAQEEPAPADAAEEEVDPQVQMVLDLVKGDDADMRTLGLQFVREQVPGEAVTKKFAELLKEVKSDAQVALLDALGERGDVVARPAILEALKADNESVRAAALKALGPLGTAAEVPVLAEKAAGGTNVEKSAARQGLIRLRGDDVNAAIVAELEKAEPGVRAKLLEVLAARNATETVAKVLECASDEDAAVQLAALGALRQLSDEHNAADLVNLLKSTKDDGTRRQAELALLTVCSRGREACTGAVLDGIADADAASRVVFLRALARIGEASALERVVAALEDEDEAVRDEAVRMLSGWRDPAVTAHLIEIASSDDSVRHQVLAIRGLVRLANPAGDQPVDLTLLGEVLALAKRPQEKQLVVGVLGGTGNPAALDLVTQALQDPAVAQQATVAAIMIAEKVAPDMSKVRGALQTVIQKTKNPATRAKAQELLDSL